MDNEIVSWSSRPRSWQKLVEESQLQYFLDEYQTITGVDLQIARRAERPDFICYRRSTLTGVELVQVMQSRMRRMSRDDRMDGFDAAIRVQDAVYAKDIKRASDGWRYAGRTILVVQLMDATVVDIAPHLDGDRMKEMASTGFIEIWIADYTVVEAYRTVQLLGVKPRRWRGLHSHRFADRKPYG